MYKQNVKPKYVDKKGIIRKMSETVSHLIFSFPIADNLTKNLFLIFFRKDPINSGKWLSIYRILRFLISWNFI